jgi:hypothetical protein
LCAQLATERVGLDVVDERALSIDLDDRQPFPVARLELRVAADVDLLEREPELLPQLPNLRPGALAEVTTLRVVQRDARYG